MKKEEIKQILKRQLWDVRYKVIDMERVDVGVLYDIAVRVNKESSTVYKVKILEGKENMTDAEETLVSARKKDIYNTIAMIKNGKKLYAGGGQEKPKFTTNFREVLK